MKLFEMDETPVETSKHNEWFTPACYVEAAREVMEGIELDPASCDFANQVVRATRYYTKEDDGLKQEWKAKSIWLNPPYGIDNSEPGKMGKWINKACHEFATGNATEVIILVNALPDRIWFQPLWEYPICFPKKRICFFNEGLQSSGPQYGNAFAYLGTDQQRFIDIFSQFGRIAKAIDTPPAKPTMRELWEVPA